MTTKTGGVLLGLLLALSAAPAGAQTTQVNLVPEDFPRWDIGGSWGPFYKKGSNGFGTHWDARNDIRVDVGRYWTTHIKTEVGVSVQWWEDYDSGTFPVPGLTPGPFTFTYSDIRQTTLSPAVTYQFLENTFAHPYVSGGVRVDITETHTSRPETSGTTRGVSYTIPAIDTRTTGVSASPFVSAGFKSYFNDRVYVRSEGLAAFGSNGPDFGVRLGFGVDF